MESNISLNNIHCSVTAESRSSKEFGQAERGII